VWLPLPLWCLSPVGRGPGPADRGSRVMTGVLGRLIRGDSDAHASGLRGAPRGPDTPWGAPFLSGKRGRIGRSGV